MAIIDQFQKKKYLNLETFRKNGEGVKTPVWFVEFENKLFVITMADSWKVKRIQRESRVKVAPCRMNGQVTGHWQPARAQEVHDPAEIETVNRLYRRKYGLMNAIFERQRSKKGSQNTCLEINLEV
jgi:PPOX class probable F420-dependent enzyme